MKEKEIYPIAKLVDMLLVISKDDSEVLKQTKDARDIQSVKVDLGNKEIYDPIPIENHLKFNPWEEIVDETERDYYTTLLMKVFSEEELVKIEKLLKEAKENPPRL